LYISAIVHLCYKNKLLQTRLLNNRNLFFLEAKSSRWRCNHGQFLVKALFLICRKPPSHCVLTHSCDLFVLGVFVLGVFVLVVLGYELRASYQLLESSLATLPAYDLFFMCAQPRGRRSTLQLFHHNLTNSSKSNYIQKVHLEIPPHWVLGLHHMSWGGTQFSS
jgi:hypothetical protein